LNALVLYLGVVAAGLARAYSRRYQVRREQAARREARLEAQLAEARLDALRRQLDPHFLFNTLNTVSALVERDPRGVRRMISRLSELLRHSFEGAGEAEVTLRAELALLSRYVEIMQVRFQGRLDVETRAPGELLDALVPSMVLQPLVENAIKHGVERSTGPARIEIEAHREGSALVLRVSDDGPGIGERDAAGSPQGVGLPNTIARLEQLYGAAQRFTLASAATGGTVAEVRLPYHVNRDAPERQTTEAPAMEGRANGE
jgi:LytS/YehU family sensor histidine kinase